MNRRNFLSLAGLAPLSLLLKPSQALAFVVFDPSNFVQNILTAIRTLMSNINEARMIANQVISLANEAKNLTNLPFDIIDDFSEQFSQLFTTVGSVNGLMQNLETLQSRFEELYPDFLNRFDPVSRHSVAEEMKKWIGTTREMMLGASKTGAEILDGLPKTQAHLQKLMADSQGAVGILQATQAGNQIAATISGSLLSLNAQLASYTQAHTAFLMELNSTSAAAKNRLEHVLDGWGAPYAGNPIDENPF